VRRECARPCARTPVSSAWNARIRAASAARTYRRIRRNTHKHTHTRARARAPAKLLSGGRRRGAVCACARVHSPARTYSRSLRALTHGGGMRVSATSVRGDPNEGRQASKLGRAGAARAAILRDSGWKTFRALVATTTTTTTATIHRVGDTLRVATRHTAIDISVRGSASRPLSLSLSLSFPFSLREKEDT